MDVHQTDIPRRGLGYLNHIRLTDNLLDINSLKYYDYGTDYEIINLRNRGNAADAARALHRRADVRHQNGKS